MRSAAWTGDFPVSQPWGPTELTVEPWYAPLKCHWHVGIDVAMPRGTFLYAIRGGVVVHETYGILGIKTASGQTDYYVHGDYLPLATTRVNAGQPIGWSSDRVPSGGSLTGPHLHFEVQPAGGVLNVPTGLDPVAVLVPGANSAAAAQLGGFGNLTDDEINAKFDLIRQNQVTDRNAILAAIAALPKPGAAPVDLSTINARLDSQTSAITGLQTKLSNLTLKSS